MSQHYPGIKVLIIKTILKLKNKFWTLFSYLPHQENNGSYNYYFY